MGQTGCFLNPLLTRLLLNCSNLGIAIVQRFSQELMHDLRIVALDEIGLVAAPYVQSLKSSSLVRP